MKNSTAVDFIVLSRTEDPLDDEVLRGIHSQAGIEVRLHRVVGSTRENDRTRWDTIARARNVGRTLGSSPWVMFVDDDVILGENCVAQLLRELHTRHELVAAAADYLSERPPSGSSKHVAMGATLFRRSVFETVGFRAEEDTCECQCMVDDIRAIPREIDYSKEATAVHKSNGSSGASSLTTKPALLTAFNRAHTGFFVERFLATLRSSGNTNVTVHAVTYGLRNKDIAKLESFADVICYQLPYSTEPVCKSRMRGFQVPLNSLNPATPVAYWDAGDVLFQGSLDPLWQTVRENSQRLLVTEEPPPWSKNPGHQAWINHIHDPTHRATVLGLLGGKQIINGGFIGGTAGRLKTYFERAARLSDGPLLGAGGGADQVTLNFCKYQLPKDFMVVDDVWNYCLLGRSGRDCKVRNGRYVRVSDGKPVAVVHGNSQSLSG